MAELARGRMRAKIPELEKALTSLVDSHHRCLLAKQLAHIDFLDEQIDDIGTEIAQRIESMSQSVERGSSTPDSDGDENASEAEETPLTWAEAVALLDTIPGVSQRTAEVMLAEMGLDMSQVPYGQAPDLVGWFSAGQSSKWR